MRPATETASVTLMPPGLSPRVRGNLHQPDISTSKPRSIPACAGEPEAAEKALDTFEVYPRVCGGTRYEHAAETNFGGLSPRVRGNRPARQACRRRGGSIPACAGEPYRSPGREGRSGVYPRVCGGIGLVLHHQASYRHGISYCHAAADHTLKGPGPSAKV